ncbi:serine/threonine-protein kinase [Halostreptopolyspora alba]|uniref:serine/threonine-protein kinase n=1 Tax=Halostreptopolyspora alba TaxID=2487137 RepID=UPI003724513A
MRGTPSSGRHSAGPYELVRELGRGGFGSVHLGRDSAGRHAAVKLLHLNQAESARVRADFAREVDAARKVNPFCIAQVLDADLDADEPWIATEYIEGPTLLEAVRADGPRTGADLQRLAVSMATALTAIHRAGIVHRDLKPGNIMLASDGPRVIDFGIARGFEGTEFSVSQMVGTPNYMAPEQLEGNRLTPAVDVYAWGAVIVFAATGRNAFTAPSQAALIRRVLLGEPDLDGTPETLLPLVRRCLAKAPEQRPNAHALLEALLDGATPGTEPGADTGGTATPAPLPNVGPESDGAPPRGPAEPAEPAPPFVFADDSYHSPGDLASAMRRNWSAAVRVFANDQERALLRTWLLEDIDDRTVDRALLRRPPEDPEAVLTEFIAQVRPDLPPTYRGRDMRLSALRQTLRNHSGQPPAELHGLGSRVLRALARHHCVEEDHTCASGAPCKEYQRIHSEFVTRVERVRAATEQVDRTLRAESPQLADTVDVPALAASVTTTLLPGLLHPADETWPPREQRPRTHTEWYTALATAVGSDIPPELHEDRGVTLLYDATATRIAGIQDTEQLRVHTLERDLDRLMAGWRQATKTVFVRTFGGWCAVTLVSLPFFPWTGVFPSGVALVVGLVVVIGTLMAAGRPYAAQRHSLHTPPPDPSWREGRIATWLDGEITQAKQRAGRLPRILAHMTGGSTTG